ncbi:Alcohol dehydrogenase transcription factor Myb/SANT-like [Nesidiocoris tenuis]|uniref:Alcohol dehydrogenase transcription factor Myb/SANT-like n=1 Tax=Nesidiocoris tenuis TaxID=355587 RepID=A0ABN7B203_9HEMI|nr:Alcohol dehydrogenase transcription factor Myb/SANT-like [Nesidiocoris tenuis]
MFDTEKFIGEIRKRPAIYDVRSKIYSNRVAKLKYWHEVGAEMYEGWDTLDMMERRAIVKELQIKWKSIRDHFMRQLKQNMNGEGPRKKKYVHFDQLQFLTTNLGAKRPRHSHKQPKREIVEEESEYIELTPELPQCERHFSSILEASSPYVDTSDFTDSREVPSASLPLDLTYHHQGTDDLYNQHREYQHSEQSSTSTLPYQQIDLSHHKEFVGDRMGNKLFLLSLLPIMERLTYHANIRARLQLMDVLHTFAGQEDDGDDEDSFQGRNTLNGQNGIFQSKNFASHSDSDT